jgi:hypothetical protein
VKYNGRPAAGLTPPPGRRASVVHIGQAGWAVTGRSPAALAEMADKLLIQKDKVEQGKN